MSSEWKPIGQVLSESPAPRGWTSNEPEASVTFHSRDGLTYHLTPTEAAKSGYREVTNEFTGERIIQFGLCLDERGEWIYPPFKRREETLEQMMDRNEQSRRRLSMCRKNRNGKDDF
jgi:hypothetical protein